MKKSLIIVMMVILVGVGCAHRGPMVGVSKDQDQPGMSVAELEAFLGEDTAQTADKAKEANETADKAEKEDKAQTANPGLENRVARLENQMDRAVGQIKANTHDLKQTVGQVKANSHDLKRVSDQVKTNTHDLKQTKGRLDHLYGVVSFNVKRTTALEDRQKGRGELSQAKISFKYASGDQIKDNANKAILDKAIREGMTPKVIIGVSDPSGGKKANTRLAEERAESLKNYLKENGVDVSGIKLLARPEAYIYGTCGPQNRAAVVYYK